MSDKKGKTIPSDKSTSQQSVFFVRVYYEDTDAGGVVYYANYLKFAERARTEWLRNKTKKGHQDFLAENNLIFAVKRVSIDYLAPARLDDLLEISSEVINCGAATLDMRQIIRHEGKVLAELTVTLVAISPTGKVLRIPESLRRILPLTERNK